MSDQEIVLEEGYFHSGNSGMSIRVVEIPENKYGHRFRLESNHGAFGEYSKHSAPLTLEMVDYLLGALSRARVRMQKAPQRTYPVFEAYKVPQRHLQVVDGLTVEAVYSDTIQIDSNTTEIVLLGFNHIDPGTKEIVKFEKYDGPKHAFTSSSCGSEEIG